MTRAYSRSTGTLAISLALWMSACVFNGTGQPSGDATLGNMRMVGTAIEAFRTAEARLPENLDAICTSPAACEHHVPARTVDEWGVPLRYHRAGSDYTLQSSGADRRFDTSDDLVFSTANERERVQLLAGCYAVSFPWWEEFTGDKLMLRTEPRGASGYELLPDVYGATGAWRPVAGDSLEMTWARGVGITRMVLQRSPDGSLHGWWRAGGEYRSSRTRQVTATRVNC
jgi:hypothetical protein